MAPVRARLMISHQAKSHRATAARLEYGLGRVAAVVDEAANTLELARRALELVEAQRNLMVSVATGGQDIRAVNQDYMQRREEIRAYLDALGIEDPNPFRDLWDWYGKWSSGDLPSYQSRRSYLRELYGSLLQQLEDLSAGRMVPAVREPTGWARVDRGLDTARRTLATSKHEEHYQSVGLLCREALISLAQAVYERAKHPPIDGVEPSQTDAKRLLEAYIAVELAGQANEATRRHATAALRLANELTHKRTATFREAAMCTEAVTSTANLIAIVSGRRDPE